MPVGLHPRAQTISSSNGTRACGHAQPIPSAVLVTRSRSMTSPTTSVPGWNGRNGLEDVGQQVQRVVPVVVGQLDQPAFLQGVQQRIHLYSAPNRRMNQVFTTWVSTA